MKPATPRYNKLRETVLKFSHLPAKTIARHIVAEFGDLVDNDLEKARTRVRYILGVQGAANRTIASDKSLFRVPGQIIKLPPTWRRVSKPYNLQPGLWLVMADLHIPYHELTPIESAIKRAQYESAIGVLLLGDFMDCASLSYWQSDRKRDFNKEVEDSIQALDWIRQELPDAQIVYKPGNHEYRLPRLFASKAPELIESPLMAWETVMGFEERGIEFLDYNQIVNAGKLPLIHGHEVRTISKAVNAARGLFLKTKSWSLCAHCHSTSQHTTRTIRKDMVTTWSIGCLCDLEPDYSPIGNDWNWGFALIQVEKNGGFEVRNFRILQSGKVV